MAMRWPRMAKTHTKTRKKNTHTVDLVDMLKGIMT